MNRARRSAPALYTIPAGVPFVDALAAGIRCRLGGGPEDLAGVTVLLPTRRACRSLGEAFLRLNQGRPLLLPRLSPIGDIDEDELALAGWDAETPGGLEVPPAISGLRRQLLLSRLVIADRERDPTPEQAARLAAELARLLDQVDTERLSFAGLAALAPEAFADHWRTTLEFLKIVSERWPEVLAAEGCLDPARRRNLLLDAQAEAWRRRPPEGPVIAAGSTGSIPATADLLGVVAHLPEGCVVLPGLDREADGATVEAVGPSHPQYGMVRLLAHLGAQAEAVGDWPHPGIEGSPVERARLINQALRPAAAISGARSDEVPPVALDGVERIDCPTPREEAGVIALVMRRTLEHPEDGRTAALITPDRALARRVAAELGRWGVEIDDSAGIELSRTPPGAFLGLIARMAEADFAPVPLLAALKHPLAAGGMARREFLERVRSLESAVLRGPRPAPGVAGLGDGGPLLEALETAVRPFAEVLARPAAPLGELLAAHVAAAEALAASDTEPGPERLWAGEAGEAVAGFVAELNDAAEVLEAVGGAAYPALFETLIAGRVVRPRYGRHPRLHIWGLLEARLQHADVVILGGLNEGAWPPQAEAGPWMSRPMMEAFGLPPPERRIGLAGHDFTQAFSAPRVVMTRSQRVAGTPTVPSRWLLRLANRLAGSALETVMAPHDDWLGWYYRLDDADYRPAPPPQPRPPLAARPRSLSVSRIETWIRDPYTIHARNILGLEPLEPIDADPGAAERGTIVHRILERFVRDHPGELPANALERLLAIGEEVFSDLMAWPGVRAFWWPRFRRIARWFVDFEGDRRRRGYAPAATEAGGRLEVAAPGGTFTLTGRADRIDRLAGGGLAIVDYKTGQPPSKKQVESGLTPQLPLEAAIAMAGGFEGVPAGTVDELLYVRLSGGREPGTGKPLDIDVAEVAADALAGLERLVAAFDDPDMPYRSRPRPMFLSRFADYDHLARVKEWAAASGEDS